MSKLPWQKQWIRPNLKHYFTKFKIDVLVLVVEAYIISSGIINIKEEVTPKVTDADNSPTSKLQCQTTFCKISGKDQSWCQEISYCTQTISAVVQGNLIYSIWTDKAFPYGWHGTVQGWKSVSQRPLKSSQGTSANIREDLSLYWVCTAAPSFMYVMLRPVQQFALRGWSSNKDIISCILVYIKRLLNRSLPK